MRELDSKIKTAEMLLKAGVITSQEFEQLKQTKTKLEKQFKDEVRKIDETNIANKNEQVSDKEEVKGSTTESNTDNLVLKPDAVKKPRKKQTSKKENLEVSNKEVKTKKTPSKKKAGKADNLEGKPENKKETSKKKNNKK